MSPFAPRKGATFDPCRLVRQVKEVGQLSTQGPLTDPCRLVRQVNQFARLAESSRSLSVLPDKPAGAAKSIRASAVAPNLAVLPVKLAGAVLA
jgi:hypothetical protein